jgi:hypothetical protein
MASSALKAHLHTSCKIVNDSHTFLLWDFPDHLLWLLPSVHQLFEDCSHTHYPWDTPTDKNMGGVQVWWMRCHSISHFLLISLSLNRSPSQARESFVVWGVAPILPEPLFISIYTFASSQWCPKLHQYCHIAHSPDLNPPDFYLWGYLKDNVYENNPQTIGELKAAITAKIREIL